MRAVMVAVKSKKASGVARTGSTSSSRMRKPKAPSSMLRMSPHRLMKRRAAPATSPGTTKKSRKASCAGSSMRSAMAIRNTAAKKSMRPNRAVLA